MSGSDSPVVDGKALVRRYLGDVFSGGNTAAADNYLRGDAFIARVAELVTRWRTAFPDFQIDVEDVIAEGDRIVAVESMSGTHDGVFESRSRAHCSNRTQGDLVTDLDQNTRARPLRRRLLRERPGLAFPAVA